MHFPINKVSSIYLGIRG